MIHIDYPGPAASLRGRQILARPCEEFLGDAIRCVSALRASDDEWTLAIDPSLLFDSSGLGVLINALRRYKGRASTIDFRLRIDPAAYRDYYSLGSTPSGPTPSPSRVVLPVTARRAGHGAPSTETLDVEVGHATGAVPYPSSLAEPQAVSTPVALLLEFRGEFDLLFANQIAIFAALARDVPRRPTAWVKATLGRGRGGWRRRLSLAYARIHRDADVHPTAVIEGSVIDAGARVGAHCVVRYSHIGEGAQLLDGAKVEFSVVGPGSWLMQDLVLIRSHVEEEVFLIHGPYQFSCFHSRSAAFATIMMDYRPDARPIKAMTFSGVREYGGRFLGALLKEGAKSLGGSLLSPGIIVEKDTWLACDLEAIHRPGRGELPRERPVAPFPARRPESGVRPAPTPFPGGSHDATFSHGSPRTRRSVDGGSARRGVGG